VGADFNRTGHLFDAWHSLPLVTVSAIDPAALADDGTVAPGSPDYRVLTVPDAIIWRAGATYTQRQTPAVDPLSACLPVVGQQPA
jgi:hypothetical protein